MPSLSINEQQIAQNIDLYQFQIEEIEDANLLDEEEEHYLKKKRNCKISIKFLNEQYLHMKPSLGESKGLDYIGERWRFARYSN